jgi:hypothetical protein
MMHHDEVLLSPTLILCSPPPSLLPSFAPRRLVAVTDALPGVVNIDLDVLFP